MRRYITTAIDFPNAAPHMGHVMEKILADTIVRWYRLQGDDVRFHVGTDENGIKIQQTAKTLGLTPDQLVKKNAPVFQDLFTRLGISFDYFIRTADPVTHWPTVTEFWKLLQKNGFIEKRSYTGLYCTGCERFLTAKDLVDGVCPDHLKAPEEVTEENWFFLLSKKEEDIKMLLEPHKGSYKIVPDWRAKETLNFLESGLEDISFSRSIHTLFWGVPVPDDLTQVMYVWCDNLTSYISSLGVLASEEHAQYWNDAEVTHVIGKDIARFHAINWPAMLQVAGLRTPDRLLIHGFLTSEGQKMSKSIGNVVSPEDVLEHFHQNPDPLRFYLSHEIPVGNDGDFSWKRIDELYTAKLANQLGNMLNRVLVMLQKESRDLRIPSDQDYGLPVAKVWQEYAEKMNQLDVHSSLHLVMSFVDKLNADFNTAEPWKMDADKKLGTLSAFAECLRHVSLLLLPFIPFAAQKMSVQLGLFYAAEMLERSFVITPLMQTWGGGGEWTQCGTPSILFPPLEK